MARKMHELLWRLREDTANEISELQPEAEINDWLDAWLDEQSELTTVYYEKELAKSISWSQELFNHGLSVKTH